jgi:hypothetical protein
MEIELQRQKYPVRKTSILCITTVSTRLAPLYTLYQCWRIHGQKCMAKNKSKKTRVKIISYGSSSGIMSSAVISLHSKTISRSKQRILKVYPQAKNIRMQLMAISLCRNSLVEYNIRLLVLQPVLEAQIARVKVGRSIIVKLAPALALRIPHQRYIMSATHGRSNMA